MTPDQVTKKRSAVAYVRASTDEQKNSLEAQQQKLTAYCQFKDIHLADTFTDAGVSGKVHFGDRPEGKALLQFLEATGIREIIFCKVDRAFRDTADCLITIKELTDAGIEVHALDLDLDTTTANGKLMLGMTALLAEWELNRRRERQMDALEVLRDDNRRLGEVPYGYLAVADPSLPKSKRDNISCRLVVDPDEQATLELIFTFHGDNKWGAQRIATWLTEHRYPTKKGGKRWASSTIEGLLANSTLEDGRTAADFITTEELEPTNP